MKLTSLTLPVEPSEHPAWLESQLVGADLRNLILELEAIRGPQLPDSNTPKPTLAGLLGHQMTEILNQGLRSLGPPEIASLLQNPRLLLDLQEAVLSQGGAYWQRLLRSGDDQRSTTAQWDRLSAFIDNPTVSSAPTATGKPNSSIGTGHTLRWLALLAACLIVAFTLWPRSGWGFEKKGLLTAKVPGNEYLESLATAAGDWFNQRPEEPQAVAKRLREFIQGCDTLIQAPHSQLKKPQDRAWLVERCRSWKSTLETQLAALEAQSRTAAETLESADETIRKLQNALRKRATEVA